MSKNFETIYKTSCSSKSASRYNSCTAAAHSNDIRHSVDCQGIRNNNTVYLRSTPNKRQLTAKTFTIYENLCDNCGQSIESNAKGRVCDECVDGYVTIDSDPSLNLSVNQNAIDENIYENVCEECGLIYSGEKCSVCAVKRTNKKLNIFHGLIDSIKQRNKKVVKDKSASSRSKSTGRRKLEIVHNVDSVFQTNISFDLNEICRLKSESLQKNVYGKLRRSDEYLLLASPKPLNDSIHFDALKPSVSESNFAHIKTSFPVSHGTQKNVTTTVLVPIIPPQKLQQQQRLYNSSNSRSSDGINSINNETNNYHDLSNINVAISSTSASSPLYIAAATSAATAPTATQLLYENFSVECDNNSIVESNNNVTCSTTIQQQRLTDVTQTQHTSNPLIELWMTSLKTYTEDYDELEQHMYYNVKCIPSRSFDCNSNFSYTNISQRNSNNYIGCASSGSDCNDSANLSAVRQITQIRDCIRTSITEQLVQRLVNVAMLSQPAIRCNSCDMDESVRSAVNFNDMLLQSKRKAIYLKDEKLLEQINDMKMEAVRSDDEQSTMALESASILRPKNRHYESLLEDDEPPEPTDMEMKLLSLGPQKPNCLRIKIVPQKCVRRKPAIRRLIIIQEMLLSISLNRALLTYDKRLQMFLQRVYQCERLSKLDHARMLVAYFSICSQQVVQCSGVMPVSGQQLLTRRPKETISDFELVPPALLDIQKTEKTDIEHFQYPVSRSETIVQKRLEDFQKPEPSAQLVKMLSDFELKIKSKQSVSVPAVQCGEEDIYQPIWMFQTVGNGEEPIEEYHDDTRASYYDSSQFCEEVDNNEWELAEEFAYATEISDETTVDLDNSEYCAKVKSACYDPYQNVSIFYCHENAKCNQIFYNNEKCLNVVSTVNRFDSGSCSGRPKGTLVKQDLSGLLCVGSKSVQAWQHMLLNVNYMEDEEDVVSSI